MSLGSLLVKLSCFICGVCATLFAESGLAEGSLTKNEVTDTVSQVTERRKPLPISIAITVPTSLNSSQLAPFQQRCHDFDRADNPLDLRGEVELGLICKALRAAGIEPYMTFISVPNYSRAVRMVENGLAHLVAETVWEDDIDRDKVYATAAIVPLGAAKKGLYLPVGHAALSASKPAELVSSLRGVSLATWTLDWQALKQTTPKHYSVSRVSAMLKLLESGRADFTFIPFPKGTALTVKWQGLTLEPLRGVQVQLASSRHFIVSNSIKDAERVFRFLNEGIARLRESGDIQRAYDSIEYNHQFTRDWRVLNAKQ